MIGQTISHYRITDELGRGGMGVVYKAEDLILKRTVALKFLSPHLLTDPQQKTRFIREAQAAAALEDHPNISTIYEVSEADGHTFMAMAYIDGEDVGTKLTSGPMSVEAALDIAVQVARGLSKVHSAGIVHRDIKPGNVIITGEGQAKVVDFGLAKLATQTKLTNTGITVGTVRYMSPEQATGGDVDHRTDIWSLGVMLYEMLAGRPPFRGDVEPAMVYSILNEDPEPVTETRKDVPVALEDVIERALAKDPAKRYETMEEFLSALETERDQITLGIKERKFTAIRKLKRRKRRVVAVLVLAFAAAGWWVWRASRPAGDGAPPPPVSFAVLPLDNLSNNPDQDYFAEGFTGELIAGLTRVDGLQVVARSSVMGFRNSDLPVARIASELGVDRVVTGTILDVDNTLRMTLEITDTDKGFAMWAGNFQGSFDEILQLQGRMIRAIVETLKGKVTPAEAAAFTGAATVDPAAYRAYLKGQALVDTWGDWEVWREALREYREAARLEPGFAPAYAAQSTIYNYMGWFQWEKGYPAMCEAAARKALELDPDLPEANAALASYLFLFENRYDEADSLFKKALKLAGGNTDVLNAYRGFLYASQQCDDAIRVARRCAELDPLNFRPSRELAGTLGNCGEFEECIKLCAVLKDRFQGETTHLDYFLAFAYAGLGEMDEALAAADRSGNAKMYMANVYWLAGQKDEAWRSVGGRETIESVSVSDSTFFNLMMGANLLVLEGDYDRAMDILEQAARLSPPVTKYVIAEFSMFGPLYDQPRYRAWMHSMNIPGY
jgi:TolB-like protein/tRNA A-37 threonylcarbamoyl transferase component Bud32/tetratricopeptide (TPR) repeat protein